MQNRIRDSLSAMSTHHRLNALLAATIALGCTACSMGTQNAQPLMQASWGDVQMSTSGSTTVIWVPLQGGRVLRLPWMHRSRRIDVRDGAEKSAVVAMVNFNKEGCDSQAAVIMFDEIAAAAEAVGECGAPMRLSEIEGKTVVVDDSTMAVFRIEGTELVTLHAGFRKNRTSVAKPQTPASAKPVPAPPAKAAQTPILPVTPVLPSKPGQPAPAGASAITPPVKALSMPLPRTGTSRPLSDAAPLGMPTPAGSVGSTGRAS